MNAGIVGQCMTKSRRHSSVKCALTGLQAKIAKVSIQAVRTYMYVHICVHVYACTCICIPAACQCKAVL